MGETRSAMQKWGPNVTEQFRIDMEKQLKALREDRVEEIKFPADLSNDQRRFVHRLCPPRQCRPRLPRPHRHQ